MSQEKDLSSVLQQYATETGVYSTQKVEQDFAQVTQQMPTEQVTSGLSEAIRSEQTPPFDQMVGQSFEQGDPRQRAGMLNHLLDGAGPAVVNTLVQNGVPPAALQAIDGHEPAVTPELAEQLHPGLVQRIALDAQRENPDVVDRMSNLYAEDPELVKTLGGETLSVALSKIAESR
jgi:hypothetical protein